MKTNKLSRRKFVALSGATLALGACKPSDDPLLVDTPISPDDAERTANEFFKNATGFDHGDDPHVILSEQRRAMFKPEYIAIVHITSSGAWSLDVNHAHFKLSPATLSDNTPANRLNEAQSYLVGKLSGRHARFRDNTNMRPYKRQDRTYADALDFGGFGFDSQHEIFIFFNSTDIRLVSGKLILFKDKLIDDRPAKPNHSFYGAKIENGLNAQLKGQGQMIRLENYFTDEQGRSLTGKRPAHEYGIGIGFVAPPTPRFTPLQDKYIIIDPDTGNGWGNEP
ncbi:MAG: hypothetical protein V3V15_09725 [Sphingorhabdus sp.]